MPRIELTRKLAHAAAWDAGNASMRAAGRKRWNEDDRDACWAEYERLWPVERELEEARLRFEAWLAQREAA
jgi:hypothetical protein